MKRILLALSCSNPDVDAASYGLVELTPAGATRLLELHRRVREFTAALARDGLANAWLAPVIGIDAPQFVAYRYSEQLEELAGEERLAELPNSLKLEIDEADDDAAERIECLRARIEEKGVALTAMSKHGDYSFTAEDLPLDLLRRVADAK